MAYQGGNGAALRRAEDHRYCGEPRGTGAPQQRPGGCPELDCVRHRLPPRVIAAAEHRARAIGVGADRVLINAGIITEQAYLTALAHWLGASFDTLGSTKRADCPLNDENLIKASAAGLLPLRHGRNLIWIVAPHGLMARRLADPNEPRSPDPRVLRLTSSECLRRFVMRHCQDSLGGHAAGRLRLNRPLLSNAPRAQERKAVRAILLAALAFVFFACAPLIMINCLSGLTCVLFLAAAMLRMLSAIITRGGVHASDLPADKDLPIYTIICALYREARVVAKLVDAIRTLDYPPEKLDVKLVLEADDEETPAALTALGLGPEFEIIVAPPIGPRTKPKALNVALPFARGPLTVVYDAEDAPEPDQLRRAVAAFAGGDKRLACVQASLSIDNTADNWLARMFTANYAGQFDALLPGLAALMLPLPLGGSSNHFRTAVLRKVDAWDPYNVTEDADLGMRLYRLGYRCAALASTTYEEAPVRFVAWLKQRTRWYKGWIQTWLVHMRRPNRLWHELGPGGAIAFQILLAANVLTALIHPFFMAGLIYTLLALPRPWAGAVLDNALPIFAASLFSGYASAIVLDVIGLYRRRLLRHAWILALTPLYWFLLAGAAWRAVFQLLSDPQCWEKTEHGLARTSRVAASICAHAPRTVQDRNTALRQPPDCVPSRERAVLRCQERQHKDGYTASRPVRAPNVPTGPLAPIAPIKLMRAGGGVSMRALQIAP